MLSGVAAPPHSGNRHGCRPFRRRKLLRCPAAHVTTIELEEERYLEAKQNFERFGISSRVTCYLGDAGEILSMMDGRFDFVFLDGPKAQYEKYLFDLKRLMPTGGVLFGGRRTFIRLGQR